MVPPIKSRFAPSFGCLILLSTSLAQAQTPVYNLGTKGPDVSNAPAVTSDRALQNFSLQLFLRTNIQTRGSQNLCVSPISVWTMLSVLLEGADGSTRNQLRKVLGYEPYSEINRSKDNKAIRKRFQSVKAALDITTPSTVLHCIDTVFLNSKKNEILPEYTRLIYTDYNVQLQTLDFEDSIASKAINRRVETITRGKIPEIVHQGDLHNTNMVVVSAAFFEGQWQTPFAKEKTRVADFFDEQGRTIGTVNMMYLEAPLPYANMESLQAKIVKLPYGDGQKLSMLVIVPRQNVAINTVFVKMQNVSVSEILVTLDNTLKKYPFDDIEISIPRFNITTNVDMKQVLQNMDLLDMFDENANFAKIFGNSGSYVSRVIHKAQIEVTEEGTIASGAVNLELVGKSSAPNIIANKPFFYLIVEETTNSIVFIGAYIKPEMF